MLSQGWCVKSVFLVSYTVDTTPTPPSPPLLYPTPCHPLLAVRHCFCSCCCVERRWHPKLHHVLVEMEKGHLKDIDLPRSLRRTYSLQQVVQVCNVKSKCEVN